MPGRLTVLDLPQWRVESVDRAAAGPATTATPVGVDPAAAADMGMALRIPAFVVVTLALGLGAHLTAGGGPPTPGSALMIGVMLAIAGRLFALREQSLPRLAAMVWAVQAGIHFVLMASHGHGGTHLIMARMGGHHLHLAPPVSAADVAAPTGLVASGLPGQTAVAGAASAAGGDNPLLMFTLHALAGLAVAAWLRRGETAVFRAACRILPRLLPRRTGLPVRPSTTRTVPINTAPRQLQGQRFIRLAAPRRGPPPLAA
jgi:hypothetical protein